MRFLANENFPPSDLTISIDEITQRREGSAWRQA